MDNKETIPITFTGTIQVPKESLDSLFHSVAQTLPAPNPAVTAGRLPLNAVTKSGLPRLAYSVRETAEVLGVSHKTVLRLLQRGLLKSSGAMRHKMIPVKEIERFLRETTTTEW